MKKYLGIAFSIVVAFAAGAGIMTMMINTNTVTINSLQANEFKQAVTSGEYTLVDIRTDGEYTAGHLKNAKQVDYYQTEIFSKYLDTLNKNRKYLIYCRTGKRSSAALKMMRDKGFRFVSDLAGGYSAWTEAGYAVEK